MEDWLFESAKKHKKKIIPLCIAIVAVDAILFSQIISLKKDGAKTEYDFLNVGQGDSELIQLANPNHGTRVKILIDGGPENGMVLNALAPLLSPTDRYIDIVAMSHAQTDHMGGLLDIAKRYRIGAFVWTGKVNDIAAFRELMSIFKKNNTKIITLARGDVIKNGASRVEVLSPNGVLLNDKDLNNSSLVLRAVSASTSALFVGDVGKNAELNLVYAGLSRADILKVPHHGSKTSVVAEFLNATHPKIAVFEVGKNSYGHPTEEALSGYTKLGASIFRTDKNGTVRFILEGQRNIRVVKNIN